MKRRLIVVGFLVGIVAIWFVAQNRSPGGVYFNGKPVEYWVRQHTRRSTSWRANENDIRLGTVVEIGTNAIAALLEERSYRSLGRKGLELSGLARFSENDIRANAVEALRRMGPKAIPVLLDCLNSPDTQIRGSAVSVLSYFAESDERVVPAVIRMVNDKSPVVRLGSFGALERIGKLPNAAENALAQHLDDVPAFPGAYLAAKALVKISPTNSYLQAKLREWTNANELPRSSTKVVRFMKSEAASWLNQAKSNAALVPIQK